MRIVELTRFLMNQPVLSLSRYGPGRKSKWLQQAITKPRNNKKTHN